MSQTIHEKTLETLRETLGKGLDSLAAAYEDVRKKASGDLPKIEKLESANPFSYADGWVQGLVQELATKPGSFSYNRDPIPPSPEHLEQEGIKKLDALKAAAETAHINNLPKIETNKLLTEKVKFIMTQIGMPTSYSKRVQKSRRSKWGYDYETVTETAGWYADLDREISVNDGYAQMASNYDSHKSALKRKADEMREKIRTDAAKKAAEEAGSREQQAALRAKEEEIERLREQVKSLNQIVTD